MPLLAQNTPNTTTDQSAVNFLEFNRVIWGGSNQSFNLFNPSTWMIPIRNVMADGYVEGFSTPGGIISTFLPYLLLLAGLILFVMLIWGAFEFMLGAADPKSADAAKKRITSAVIGFLLLFTSYWIAQIFQALFGLDIGLG